MIYHENKLQNKTKQNKKQTQHITVTTKNKKTKERSFCTTIITVNVIIKINIIVIFYLQHNVHSCWYD